MYVKNYLKDETNKMLYQNIKDHKFYLLKCKIILIENNTFHQVYIFLLQ